MPPKSRRKSGVATNPPVEESPKKKETKEEKKKRLAEERAKAKAWAEDRKKKVSGVATAVSSPSPKKMEIDSGEEQMKSPSAVSTKKRSTRRSSTEPSSAPTRASSSKKVKRKKEDTPPKEEEESDDSSTEVKKPLAKRRKTTESPEKKKQTPVVAVETTVTTASVSMDAIVSPRPSRTKKSARSAKKSVPPPAHVAIAPVNTNVIKSPTKKRVTTTPTKKKTVMIQETPIVAHLEEEPLEEEQEEKSSMHNKIKKMLLLPVLITLLGFMALAFNASSNVPKTTPPPPQVHQDESLKESCFFNHGIKPRSEMKMIQTKMDDGSIQPVETKITIPLEPVNCMNPTDCPQNARCEGGIIVDCLDNSSLVWELEDGSESSFYILNEEKNACVLSPDALKGLLSIHSTLVNLTLEQVCSSSFGLGPNCSVSAKDIWTNNDGTEFMFDINAVAKLSNMSSMDNCMKSIDLLMSDDSLSLPSAVISRSGNDGVQYVGLSPDYVENHLPIPFSCWMRTLGWNLIYACWSFIYVVIGTLLNIGWFIFSSKPIPTFIVSVLIYIIVWIRGRRLKNANLRKRVAEVQKLAYDKLMIDCDEGEGYATLHLRDEIAHELYPEPCYERKFLVNDVWPRVVNAVRVDNRVNKSRKSIGGKNLEWWEWVVEPARRSRRSLGGSGAKKKEE